MREWSRGKECPISIISWNQLTTQNNLQNALQEFFHTCINSHSENYNISFPMHFLQTEDLFLRWLDRFWKKL